MDPSQRKGKLWTEPEMTQLKEEVQAAKSLEEIAATHNRSPLAIDCKLAQVGKIRVDAGETLETVQAELRFTPAAYKKICAPKKPREPRAAPTPIPIAAPLPTDPLALAYAYNRLYEEFRSRVMSFERGTRRVEFIISLFAVIRKEIDDEEAYSLARRTQEKVE